MTEEDTFRRLRRTPISRLRVIINTSFMHTEKNWEDWYREKCDILQQHGWNHNEYQRALHD